MATEKITHFYGDIEEGKPFASFGPEVCDLMRLFGVAEPEKTRRVVIDFQAGDVVTVTIYQNALFPQLEKVKEFISKFKLVTEEKKDGCC